jgi:hypothetical protein
MRATVSGGSAQAAQLTGTSTAGSPAPGTRLWARRSNDSASEGPNPVVAAVSPGGGRVFVTGNSGTVAYRAATGALLWGQRGDVLYAESEAVSPSGSTVYVAGDGPGTPTAESTYATIAYNATTGAPLWESYYHGPNSDGEHARAVAVSPSGNTVFVTGESPDTATGTQDWATVAYNATTGAQLWVARYRGGHAAADLVVGPGGGRVFVTGDSTVAYNAATGAKLWARPGNSGIGYVGSIAVSPHGTAVFITGHGTAHPGIATFAYDTATGAQLWAKRYHGPGNGGGGSSSVAVAPGGGRVFVTGTSAGSASGADYATIAYRTSTGAQLWVKRYNGPGNGDDRAGPVAVSPDGRQVFVTGTSPGTTMDYMTLAYRARTGAWLWGSRYDGPSRFDDLADSVAVSPTSKMVFVTGESFGHPWLDYATIAYRR